MICLEYLIPIISGNPTQVHAHGKLPHFSEYHRVHWIPGTSDTAPLANKSNIAIDTGDLEAIYVLIASALIGYTELKEFSLSS